MIREFFPVVEPLIEGGNRSITVCGQVITFQRAVVETRGRSPSAPNLIRGFHGVRSEEFGETLVVVFLDFDLVCRES